MLDRQGEGRIAVLASDQAWLWSRGYEGGGPQLELLRRLAHWLMKEPELEEEVLRGTGEDGDVRDHPPHPGRERAAGHRHQPLGRDRGGGADRGRAGRWEGRIEAAENGVWRLANGDREAVAVVGPSAPKEFENPVSSGDVLAPLADGDARRRAAAGGRHPRPAPGARGAGRRGRGWIGLADRDAYQLRDIRQVELAPGWLMLILAAGLSAGLAGRGALSDVRGRLRRVARMVQLHATLCY